jgi:CRP-like cAMP-binding protein
VTIVQDLLSLPLFQGIPEDRLGQLVDAFRSVKHPSGTVLFTAGEVATKFEILLTGEVVIEETSSSDTPSAAAGTRLTLRNLAPLGELGALTGLPRSTTATAQSDVEVLSVGINDLLGFFDKNADVGLHFYKNLLSLVSDKIRRDRSRIDDMRTNLVRTQKSMKKMREQIEEAEETELSRPLYDTLDQLINNNRRANYRVSPTPTYPAHVRLDDGKTVPVLELSEGYMKIEGKVADVAADPQFWTGVLVVPQDEILLSGSVLRQAHEGVVVKLDRPIDEYKAKLDDYTTRVQLLDFVV